MKAHVRIAVTVLLFPLLALAACAQGASNQPEIPPTSQASATAPTSGIELTIMLTESPETTPREFLLVAHGPTPDPSSTLPDPTAALAAVELHGEKMFFPVPDPTRVCTQQYGGPEIAVVTGWFKGKEVNATFKRTDGCEIARWRAMAPLFGALAGGTGAI